MKSVLAAAVAAAAIATPAVSAAPKVCAKCVRANMESLAGGDFNGRACGTADENAAARFIAARLKVDKVAGALPGGAYLQPVQFRTQTYAVAPTLEVGDLTLTHGREFIVLEAPESVTGALAVVTAGAAPRDLTGKVAVLVGASDVAAASVLIRAGALAVLVSRPDSLAPLWAQMAARMPGAVEVLGTDPPAQRPPARPVMNVTPDAFAALKARDGQPVRLTARRGEPKVSDTFNVLGVVHGTAPDADRQAILLSAHYDHVGVVGGKTYPGANDDASGTAAVMEFARLLGAGKRPKRTVVFALFSCEERGGYGARYFLAHPPLALTDFVANLEFEMIGNRDPQHPKTLMMTGWERSNLGATLAAQGAAIGPDPYPEQNFFQRSDNYQLARRGVVAHTISAWATTPTYHQPTDDLAHIDMDFMLSVIQSLAGPIDWLANTDFRPAWTPGGQPQ